MVSKVCKEQVASVPLGREPTIQNIKEACKRYFNVDNRSNCDVLAGERGPSWTEITQINNWKVIHVRFIEGCEEQGRIQMGATGANAPVKFFKKEFFKEFSK
jgi:hypothetical protein